MNDKQWNAIEEKLKQLYNSVTLDCDGYHLRLMLAQIDTYKNAIVIYVNGRVSPHWLFEACEERRRFCRAQSRYVHSASRRAGLKKISKKVLKRCDIDPDRKVTRYSFFWTNFRSMRRHLERNNEAINLVFETPSEVA